MGSYIGDEIGLYTKVIPKTFLATTDAERTQMTDEMVAQMKAEHPDTSPHMDETFYSTGWKTHYNHVVFAVADVTFNCVSKVLFAGEGWTYEEATADAKKQATAKSGVAIETFTVIKEITGP